MKELYLKVPGQWLETCGMGTEDRVFPILQIDKGTYRGIPVTFVTVNRDGQPWVVHKEVRRAEYVHNH